MLKEQGSHNLVQNMGHKGSVLRPRCIGPGRARTQYHPIQYHNSIYHNSLSVYSILTHVSTFLCHHQGVYNQCLAKLHTFFKLQLLGIQLIKSRCFTSSLYKYLYTGLFISPSGISELNCSTTKTDTAERSISIGRESLQVFLH